MRVTDVIAKLKKFNIVNELEIAHFLAQASHESQGFTKFSEGAKYTFGRAKAIWPSQLSAIKAMQKELLASDKDYCPQPWLFNLVYGWRMGNEDNGTDDNDGYDYRGAGVFQLTGIDNYKAFLKWLGNPKITIDTIDDYCRTEEGAILSAIWFWQANKIGSKAKKDDLLAVTKSINGGIIGIEERKRELIKYKKLLGVKL